MVKETDPYQRLHVLSHDAFELRVEYTACDNTAERRVIGEELYRVQAAINRHEQQTETFRGLPDFWADIYGAGTGYIALFSGRRAAKRLEHPQEGYFPYPDATATAVHWAMQHAEQGREVYQCGHLLTEPRRRKTAAAPLWALYVDLDSGQLPKAIAVPSITVESSPGRLQCYWCLQEPVAPAGGEALNRRLGQAVGADKSGWDLTQLLRVPGTRNRKYAEAPLVKVLAVTGRRYRVDELFNPLADLPLFAAAAPPAEPVRERGLTPAHLTATALRVYSGEAVKRTPDGRVDRSAALVQIARVLAGTGLSRPQIAAALAERDETLGWRKYSDREDAQVQYDRIAELVTRRRR